MEDKRPEDLDLFYLFGRLRKSVAGFFDSVWNLIVFSFRNFLRIMLFILAGILVSIGASFMYSNYFKSTMIVSHTRLNNSYCAEMISGLNSYINGNGNTELAKVLKISPKQCAQLKSLEYAAISESLAFTYKDSLNSIIPFKVIACVYDVKVLDTLQTAIINYMESNSLAVKLKEFDRESYARTIEQLEKEIAQNDSLKKIINSSIIPRGPSGLIYGEPLDPVNVYRRTMELFEKKVAVQIKLKNINTFDVAVDFNKSARKHGPGMFSFTLTGSIIGYIVGVIYMYKRRKRI